ncbi:hypothetical protein BJP27_24175 (plasmid) [Pseudomonas oryzihabitans]|nr:hypothetical protein BJP27_24175 [Pseudomonas psychrotolerans]
MQTIDVHTFIQRVQEARATLGVTIYECAEKISKPPYCTFVRPEDWTRFERNEIPAQPEFCAKVAAMLGIEVPLVEAMGPSEKTYKCATLTEDERDELERLADQVTAFCKAKGVALVLMTTSNLTRTAREHGHTEESLTNLQLANVFALPSPMAPLVQMITEIAKGSVPDDLDESHRRLEGFTKALARRIDESLELAPAGTSVLEGYRESRPIFKTT